MGWHKYTGSSMSSLSIPSAAHLIRDGSDRPLCGRHPRGRGFHHDTAKVVVSELQRGERKACSQCFTRCY